ncbi:MAG: hypothetical protein P4L90_25905 [Rhodopila sp.]|nr:hypothetical protein [Rhodopila sp.]
MNALTKSSSVPSAELTVLAPQNGASLYRVSTDAAEICRAIVVATAKQIGDRQYVQVEGWQAIAVAHGCAASSGEVVRHPDGSVSAVGRIVRIDTGAIIASAEGYVGADEPTWFGGTVRKWKWGEKRGEKVWYEQEMPKRADYAIRAMAQTRAISRACRSAFAHVVVMMNAGLSTTPAEEVPEGGFYDAAPSPQPPPETTKPSVKEWLETLDRNVKAAAAANDVDALRAILAREDVKVALEKATGPAAEKLHDILVPAIKAAPAQRSAEAGPDFMGAEVEDAP